MAIQKNKRGEVTFICSNAPSAKSVYLAGDFNHWDPQGKKMDKAKDGSFKAKLTLSPGKHQYKFVADGTWIEDSNAPEIVANSFGTVNSVVEI